MDSPVITYREALQYARQMQVIVKETGQAIMRMRGGDIFDQHSYKGHESSSLDECARNTMRSLIDRQFPDFHGCIRFELHPISQIPLENNGSPKLFFFIDEIEGTTNTKRCLAGPYDFRPQAMISMALAESESLSDTVCSAVYTLDHNRVLWAVRVAPGYYTAFHEDAIIHPDDIAEARGDSKRRIVVAGYSNSHRAKKAELEEALWQAGFVVYDGCRASGIDIRNIIYNSFDAYVDLRSFWSTKSPSGEEKEAMLQTYDVAGMLPIALGSGLCVSDADGSDLSKYGLVDSIPLVVARPGIHDRIIAVTSQFTAKWRKDPASKE